MSYTQDLAPLGSLGLSALVACLPLMTVFITLGVLRWKAHWAGLSGLAVAVLVAVLVYGVPAPLAGLSATQGFAFGLFPIIWIVLNAIWLYELTVRSGRFELLRRVIDAISDDPRIQAIIIAFGFGGLLEALAGFGAPVAITGVMLLAVGFSAMRTAVIVLLANTAPVAFGSVGIPIITAGNLTGIDYHEIGAVVGHQTPLIAFMVPALLVLIADGRRGLRETWPAAITVGLSFGIAQWVAATYVSVELTDIVAALVGIASAVVLLRFWRPAGTAEARERLLLDRQREEALVGSGVGVTTPPPTPGSAGAAGSAGSAASGAGAPERLTPRVVVSALFPYLLVVVVFALAKLWTPFKDLLVGTDVKIPWPGLDGAVLSAAGSPIASTTYTFPWLSSAGTLLIGCGLVVGLVQGLKLGEIARAWVDTVAKLRFSMLTVGSVLALAYVMNQSGQTLTIGAFIAGTGAAFAFLSPVLGWLGTAVTGSDTSANALFATLQQSAAERIGLDPTLMVAANTSGGVVGKMISPQNLTIAATAVGLVGRESDLLRRTIWWSLGMLLALCLLVGLQSSVLAWMLP